MANGVKENIFDLSHYSYLFRFTVTRNESIYNVNYALRGLSGKAEMSDFQPCFKPVFLRWAFETCGRLYLLHPK